ncbi:MAG: hypothetical protein AAGF86_18800 [Pseudomonadota bacterium]
MTDDAIELPQTAAQAHADLAFLRSVVGEYMPFARNFGLIYMTSGIVYGIQCLFGWLFIKIGPGVPMMAHLTNSILPTVIFIGVIIFGTIRNRKEGKLVGPVARGIEATFQGTGLANGVMIVIFGVAALRASDLAIWLFYPVMVCVLQGAVWYGAAVLRRRWWMGFVAGGWFIAALGAGLSINNIENYIAILGIALVGLMAWPGFVVMRINQQG